MKDFKNYQEFEDFILEGQDRSKIDFNHQPTEEEKEMSSYVRMCYLISGATMFESLSNDDWNELVKYGMVIIEKRKMGTRYYATEKALKYVESVDSDYANKISAYRKDENILWDDCDSAYYTVDGVKADISNIMNDKNH